MPSNQQEIFAHSEPVTFEVSGEAFTQGSKSLIQVRGKGARPHQILVEHYNLQVRSSSGKTLHKSGRLKRWRQAVATSAKIAFRNIEPHRAEVSVTLRFRMMPAHFRRDIDKLSRAILDAITGIAYLDDEQVSELVATKDRRGPGETPGVTITVEPRRKA